jgi:hypothetical protein
MSLSAFGIEHPDIISKFVPPSAQRRSGTEKAGMAAAFGGLGVAGYGGIKGGASETKARTHVYHGMAAKDAATANHHMAGLQAANKATKSANRLMHGGIGASLVGTGIAAVAGAKRLQRAKQQQQ